MAGIVCDDLECIMVEGSIISEIWCEGYLLYQYDSVAPTLAVTAPAGTASGTPTYTTAGTFRVHGTVTDAESGVAAVYVNGAVATLSGNTWYKDITIAANTTVAVQVYAVDKAGNRTATITRYVRYDSAAPALAVTAPAGTSAAAPTYVQSDAAMNYTVSGTVSDASGIKSVTVNGYAATVNANGTWSRVLSLATNTTHTIKVVATDKAGRTTTVNRYLRVEAYYQQAARLAGTAVQTSLGTTLQNSTVCTAIAGNSTAYGVMKSHYASTMKTYIDSYWSTGLNLLNYRCQLKCYLVRNGTDCTAVTGGWNSYLNGSGSEVTWNKYTYDDYYLVTMCWNATACKSMATTKNQINLTGYTTMYAYARGIDNSYGEAGRFGVSTISGFGSTEENNLNLYTKFDMTDQEPIKTHTLNIASITTGYYVKLCSSLWGGSNGCRRALWKNIYIA